VDPALDAWTASSEIYDALKIAERTGSNRQQDLNLIGAALRKLGTEVELRWIDGKKRRGWRGVKREVVADRIPFLPDQENSG
jgi:hypothetical protein